MSLIPFNIFTGILKGLRLDGQHFRTKLPGQKSMLR